MPLSCQDSPGTYEILALIGGLGEVYKAGDTAWTEFLSITALSTNESSLAAISGASASLAPGSLLESPTRKLGRAGER